LDILNTMNELNPGKNIVSVFDYSFRRFGAVHEGYKTDSLMDYLKHKNIVTDDTAYTADVPQMRKELALQLSPIISSVYAGMDVQSGLCCGRNNMLNGLEYHQGSEVYILGTDVVMMLGLEEDIKWPEGIYDSLLIKSFYAPKGSVIELRGGCLHYLPVNVYHNDGISVIVSLLNKTNSPIDFELSSQGRDKLLIAKNSWFLAHPDFEPAKNAGWHLGIKGENLSYKTL